MLILFKKKRLAILLSDKIDSKAKQITVQRIYFIMIQRLIYPEAILNVHAPEAQNT